MQLTTLTVVIINMRDNAAKKRINVGLTLKALKYFYINHRPASFVYLCYGYAATVRVNDGTLCATQAQL